MLGSRPLEAKEVKLILKNLKKTRDRCLFIVGQYTGYRISELLSLRVSDVLEYNAIKQHITVFRRNMKGKQASRTVVLHNAAKEALMQYIEESRLEPQDLLFPISRVQAYRVIKQAAIDARLSGRISTHSMRKTFAKRVYNALDKDLVATQQALGHQNLSSTVKYLSFEQSDIDNAILGKIK